jgi:hypothetical protein
VSDDYIKTFLRASNTKEAIAWLQAGSESDFRSVGECESTQESLALIQQIYDAGAKEVLAVQIDEYPEGQNTGKLVVILPDPTEARERVFDWAGEIAQSQGFDAEQDSGQSFLFVMLD